MDEPYSLTLRVELLLPVYIIRYIGLYTCIWILFTPQHNTHPVDGWRWNANDHTERKEKREFSNFFFGGGFLLFCCGLVERRQVNQDWRWFDWSRLSVCAVLCYIKKTKKKESNSSSTIYIYINNFYSLILIIILFPFFLGASFFSFDGGNCRVL